VACHKIESRLDAGDILADETFPLTPDECHESLDLKTQMAFGRLARHVARNLPRLWDEARPQQGGRYWPLTPPSARVIDFSAPVANALDQARAFGLTETVANLNGMTLYVRRLVGWPEAHGYAPGTIVHTDGRRMVVAALDGFIGIIEWSPINLAATEAVGR
jgi:methionyl-tRNA formyltransferase